MIFGNKYREKKWATKRTSTYLAFDPSHFALGFWVASSDGVFSSINIALLWFTFNLYVYPYDKNY